jgi:hypothetical protein
MLFARQFLGFIAYVATIIALPLIIISVASHLASDVQQHMSLSGAVNPRSRVDVGLQAQARAASWQAGSPTTSAVKPPTPEVSAVLLAKGIDEAEASSVTTTPAARVVGWIKRAKPQPQLTSESPGRIIERSLSANF